MTHISLALTPAAPLSGVRGYDDYQAHARIHVDSLAHRLRRPCRAPAVAMTARPTMNASNGRACVRVRPAALRRRNQDSGCRFRVGSGAERPLFGTAIDRRVMAESSPLTTRSFGANGLLCATRKHASSDLRRFARFVFSSSHDAVGSRCLYYVSGYEPRTPTAGPCRHHLRDLRYGAGGPNTDLFTFALHVAHACSAFSSGTLHERNQEGGDAVLVAGHFGSFEFGQAFAKALADRKRDIDNELLPMHSITHMKVALIKVRRHPSIG